MVTFGNDTITTNDTKTDFDELGEVKVEDLNLPVYGLLYKGQRLKEYDEQICEGDCHAYLLRSLYFGIA